MVMKLSYMVLWYMDQQQLYVRFVTRSQTQLSYWLQWQSTQALHSVNSGDEASLQSDVM